MKKVLIVLGIAVGIGVLVYGVVRFAFPPPPKPQGIKTQEVSAAPYKPQPYINIPNRYSLSLFSPGLRWEFTESGGETTFSRSDKVTLRLKIMPLAGAEGTKYLDNRKKGVTEGAKVDRRTPVSGKGWKGELIQVSPANSSPGTKARNEIYVFLQHGSRVSEWTLNDEDFENLNEPEVSAFLEKTLPSFKI